MFYPTSVNIHVCQCAVTKDSAFQVEVVISSIFLGLVSNLLSIIINYFEMLAVRDG